MVKAKLLNLLEILLRGVRERHLRRAIDALGDLADGFGDFRAFGVGVVQGSGLAFAGGEDFLGERLGASASLGKPVAKGDAHALCLRALKEHGELGFVVAREVVHGHDDLGAEGLQVVDVGFEVAKAFLQGLHVGSADFGKRHAAVPVKRPQARDEHGGRRMQVCRAALDVVELLRSKVAAEARFRDGEFAHRKRGLRGGDGVAAVGDVGKGAAVHEGGRPFQGLHHVGLHGFQKECHQGARGAEFAAGEGRAVALDADDEPVDAGAEVFFAVRKAEDGHEFARRRDVKARFRGDAVGGAAQAVHDVAEHAVVHVQDAAPRHFLQVHLSLMAGVVDQGRKEVVRRGDRMKVAREVQVD